MATVSARVVSCALGVMRRTCASLLEENQSLRVQLKSFDEARRRAEQQVAELRGRAHQAEVAAAQQLRRKEAEWMAEYDRGVQALLKIIQHHESETAQLRAEVGKLRATVVGVPPSITKMTRATQTDNGRPTKVMTRRNSVRFAPNENDSAVDKEESWGIDPKTKRDIARMQHLFEELQLSTNQRGVKEAGARRIRDHKPHRSIKEEVVERLTVHQTVAFAGRRRCSETTVPEQNKNKTIETQTEDIPVPASSASIQQDLEERNRLLHERLTSQQNMLDQLLHTKLRHTNANPGKHMQSPLKDEPVNPSDGVQDGAGRDLSETSNKPEHSVAVVDSPRCLGPDVAVRIDPIRTTERRPLSPPAA